MSIDAAIASAITAAVAEANAAVLARTDALLAVVQSAVSAVNAQSAVTRDLAEQVRAARAEIAELAAPPVLTPPVVVEPPAPAPGPAAVEPAPAEPDSPDGTRIGAGQSLRWQGGVWTIVGGRVQRDGQSTADVALTAGVEWLAVNGDTLEHGTAAGEVWRYTGAPDWALQEPVKIIGEGVLGV